ncbi:PIR Superfamily Protein [Plasmodium ovale wallikeri]|uniref:PIR Superfamily Protein n=2 Tax=Plasmodium ovale TaxID=36330 RepID=A0A1A9AGC6_PLAOA|nr:PIR Superfamily Protein [Plasmodium ovale wallikeri]SBT56311.1 PIR Superfamily Protein [Plasmodium ovale wallikeri]SBT73137.1 PIR protein [Plasmodium ovale]
MDENHESLKEEIKKDSNLRLIHTKLTNIINNVNTIYETCSKLNKRPATEISLIDNKLKLSWEEVLSELKQPIPNDNTRCYYLLYWMYGKIVECKSNNYCASCLYSIFDLFWKSSKCCDEIEENDNKGCNRKFVKEYNVNVLKNRIELYQFLEFYDNIKHKLKNGDTSKKKLFCKYINDIFSIYRSMSHEDEKLMFKKYEKELKLFNDTFNNGNELSELERECDNLNLSKKFHIEKTIEESLSQDSDVIFRPVTDNFYEHANSAPKEMDEILKDTPSYILYKEFDEQVKDNEISSSCDIFDKVEGDYKNDSKKICNQIVRNLKNLNTITSEIKPNKRCLHLKNWVYGKIWKMFIDKKDYKYVKSVIIKFMELQNNTVRKDKKHFCHYYFIFKDITELNAKKEEKDLHDYFENYSIIENNISSNTVDKEKYIKYLEYIIRLYKRRKEYWDCCDNWSGVDPLCQHYFKCDEQYDPHDLVAILNGTNKEDIKKKYKKGPVVLIGDEKPPENTNEKDLMRIGYGRCAKVYDPENPKNVFGLRCDYKASSEHYKNFVSELPNGKKKVTEGSTLGAESLPPSINISGGTEKAAETETNPVYFKIATSSGLVLGIVSIFFLYYKFTPFGSLFSIRDRKQNRFEDDFHEEFMQQLSLPTSEYADIIPHNRRIQLAYQRA